MNKTVKKYLEIFFTCEMDEVEGQINREILYLEEVEDKKLKEACLTVVSDLNEYLMVLKTLYNRVERGEF